MYLVTDRSTLTILSEHPMTIEGYKSAILTASCLAQFTELHPSGIILEKRLEDSTIKEVVSFVVMGDKS